MNVEKDIVPPFVNVQLYYKIVLNVFAISDHYMCFGSPFELNLFFLKCFFLLITEIEKKMIHLQIENKIMHLCNYY